MGGWEVMKLGLQAPKEELLAGVHFFLICALHQRSRKVCVTVTGGQERLPKAIVPRAKQRGHQRGIIGRTKPAQHIKESPSERRS